MNNQTSDTPETDGKIKRICGNWNNAGDRLQDFVLADIARKLERERDQWVAKAAELSAERESNAMQALAYEAERDEAKKLLELSKRARASLNEACDHLQRELDEARASLAAAEAWSATLADIGDDGFVELLGDADVSGRFLVDKILPHVFAPIWLLMDYKHSWCGANKPRGVKTMQRQHG